MAKKMPSRMPKDKPPEEQKGPPEPSPEDRDRIRIAVLGGTPTQEKAPDVDLDQPVSEVILGKSKDDATLGPWREKQLVPYVAQYMKGMRQMYPNRLMQDDDQIKAYSEGLDNVSTASLGVMEILLKKYLGNIPYAEECFCGLTLVTAWKGQDRLDARLKARDASRPRG
jgi:hypothetical protein